MNAQTQSAEAFRQYEEIEDFARAMVDERGVLLEVYGRGFVIPPQSAQKLVSDLIDVLENHRRRGLSA